MITDQPTDSTKMWNGQVQKLRKVAKKPKKYKISYWEVTGNFAESEDTDMTVVEIAANFFLHDLEYDLSISFSDSCDVAGATSAIPLLTNS
jgi:hypothetical protein